MYKMVTPIWPLLPVQTGSEYVIFQKIISQQPQEVNSQFFTIVQIIKCQKIFIKKWPQFDLYFLSKPEMNV